MKTLKILALSCMLLIAFGCSKENIETENTTESVNTELQTRGGNTATILIQWEKYTLSPVKQQIRDTYLGGVIDWSVCPNGGGLLEVWSVNPCGTCIPGVPNPAEDTGSIRAAVPYGDCNSGQFL